MSDESLPPVTEKDLQQSGLPSLMKMSPGLALYFNDAIYNRVKQIAGHMAKAEGVTPRHLLGKPEACFAVATRAITWNLDPQSVAAATWQTPSGQIGYEAKLIVAIMENSGALDGRVAFEYKGDWSRLRGKFKQEISGKGNKYFVPNWPPEFEKDLSIVVSCQIKGETTRREEGFWLEELWPRNSTLWAIRPRQQATYAVSRAFANIATPGLILGLPFDIDPSNVGDGMVDITPAKPTRSEFDRSPARDPAMGDWIAKLNFATALEDIGVIRAAGLKELSAELHQAFEEAADSRAHQIEAAAQGGQEAEEEGAEEQVDPSIALLATLHLAKTIPQVANIRAEGIKTLPGRDHAEWNANCDAKAKEITDAKPKKPAAATTDSDRREAHEANGNGKGKTAPTKAAKAGPETPLARGLRLLKRVDTAPDIKDLQESMAAELTGADLAEWKMSCADRMTEIAVT